jgi:hypothetical protein
MRSWVGIIGGAVVAVVVMTVAIVVLVREHRAPLVTLNPSVAAATQPAPGSAEPQHPESVPPAPTPAFPAPELPAPVGPGPAAEAPQAKVDKAFVGNWMIFLNRGGATGNISTLYADVDETGRFMAYYHQSDLPPIIGRIEAGEGRWKLVREKEAAEEGTYSLQPHLLQTTSPLGQGQWIRQSEQSKQKVARELKIDLRKASLRTLVTHAETQAKAWKKDAVLVEVRCEPSRDGSIDLTQSQMPVMLYYYNPADETGMMAWYNNWAELTANPARDPVTAAKLPLRASMLDLPKVIDLARKDLGVKGRPHRAELRGIGHDPNLLQYAWVVTFAEASACVDAELYEPAEVQAFYAGRGTHPVIPFIPKKPRIYFSRVFTAQGEIELMWHFTHILRIEGMEPLPIQVPWRIVGQAELDRHKTVEEGKEVYRTDTELYPFGEFTPLEGQILQRFLKRGDAVPIGVPPYAIRVERLRSLPEGSAEKIRAHVEMLAAQNAPVRR